MILRSLYKDSILYVWFLALSSTPVAVYSQTQFQPVKYSSEDGLSENVVYCLHRDKKGYIWAGTDYGLNRFDGYVFKNYHHHSSDPESLSSHSILCIEEDSHGKFWIGTYGGLNYFNPETGKAKHIKLSGKGLSYHVTSIVIKGDFLFMSTAFSGPLLYDIKRDSLIEIAGAENASYLNNTLYQFPEGIIGQPAIQSSKGFVIAYADPLSKSIRYATMRDVLPFAKESGFSFYYNSSDNYHFLFSGNDKRLSLYAPDGKFIADLGPSIFKQFPGINLYCIEQHEDQFWIGSSKGLIVYDLSEKTLSFPQLVSREEKGISTKEIRSMLNDNLESIWLGTFGSGMLRIDTRKSHFNHISQDQITQSNTTGMIFTLALSPENKLAVQTNQRWYIQENNSFVTFKELSLTPQTVSLMNTGKNVGDLSAFHQKIIRENNFEPLSFVIPNDTTLLHYKFGIRVYTPSATKQLAEALMINYTEDNSYYWFASDHGLHRINKITLKDSVYLNTPGNSLSENFLYCVYKDENEKGLWIGTKGGGLNYFDISESKFTAYTNSHGLPDNVIYSMVPTHDGDLWLSTNKGLSRFNRKTKTFINYSRRDGLLNTEFNRSGGVKTPDGTIYFSGTTGIDYFHPDSLKNHNISPEVYISEIHVNQAPSDLNSISDLPYFENDLAFHFTSNQFTRPDLVYFRYRLDEDADWTRILGVNYVNLSRLTPGKYMFEVQASNDNLHWSESAFASFHITVPWWKSWWFVSVLVLLFIVTLYALYKFRINQINKLVRLRSKISRDLHDDLGSTLSSIHVYSSIASKSIEKNAQLTKKALDHIRHNSRQVIDNMSDIVWAINRGQNGQTTLEDKLKNYGYEFLTPLEIKVDYHIDEDAARKINHIEARKNILLIVKEAMNNIAKYSQASEATVSVEIKNNKLLLVIRDNGKGFNVNQNKSGNGIQNIQHRTEVLGGKFLINSEPGKGTLLQCSFPLTNISNMMS